MNIKKLLGLKGSWPWAVRKMKKGLIVMPGSATGVVRLKLDSIENGRIIWAFPKRTDPLGLNEKWESANIFVNDFDRTNWVIVR